MSDVKTPIGRNTQNQEDVFEVIEDSLRDLWSLVDNLSRIHPPNPQFYRVTVFGSARMCPGDTLYEETRELARRLASMGCDIVTGGGPGLMQAANEGEMLGDPDNRTRSFGLPIELPTEEQLNPFVELVYRHRTFFTRLHHFVRLSNAFIVMRGGIGTTLETMMVWQLCQVRHVQGTPLVFVGEMWKGLVEWAKTYMINGRPNLANPADLELPICVQSIDDAVAVIDRHKTEFDAAIEE